MARGRAARGARFRMHSLAKRPALFGKHAFGARLTTTRPRRHALGARLTMPAAQSTHSAPVWPPLRFRLDRAPFAPAIPAARSPFPTARPSKKSPTPHEGGAGGFRCRVVAIPAVPKGLVGRARSSLPGAPGPALRAWLRGHRGRGVGAGEAAEGQRGAERDAGDDDRVVDQEATALVVAGHEQAGDGVVVRRRPRGGRGRTRGRRS